MIFPILLSSISVEGIGKKHFHANIESYLIIQYLQSMSLNISYHFRNTLQKCVLKRVEMEGNRRKVTTKEKIQGKNDHHGDEDTREGTCEESPEELFQNLYDKAIKLGLTGEDFAQLESLREIQTEVKVEEDRMLWMYCQRGLYLTLGMFLTLMLVYLTGWPISNERLLSWWFNRFGVKVEQEPCVINMPDIVQDIFRPPVDCDMCTGLSSVERVSNITWEEFEERFAYSAVPVVVTDGAKNWTAPDVFCFDFFKELYKEDSPALENVERNCQFFPYKTSFRSLREVFQMSTERAHLEDKTQPWYIGWSNCDYTAGSILRQHYRKPYFLPRSSESSKTDWIFMGSPGYGAHMHIDNVMNPSWQAQIRGTKKWTLEPPPECYYTCPDRLEIVVHPGEIFVLDTNKWFHSTLNVGDDISICIGSEYD